MEDKRRTPSVSYIDAGLEFAIAVAIGVGLGYYADKKLHTFPVFLIAGLLLGATSGFLNLYRVAFPKRQERKNKQTDNDG